jgi:hypothetical protein
MRSLLLPSALILLAACHRQTDEEILDHDDDGHLPTEIGGDDCDDGDPAVSPDADEKCGDGLDNDCDGAIDDAGQGDQPVWFDGDGDGFGDPNTAARACEPGANQVLNAEDCDDSNAEIGKESLHYTDEDADGLGVGAATATCPGPNLADVGGDCDDADPAVGEPTQLFDDLDGDGFGTGTSALVCPGPNLVDNGFDCDDTNADIGVGTPTFLYTDGDGDGFGGGVAVLTCPQPGYEFTGGDCDDTNPDIGVGVPELLFEDLDGDGIGNGAAVLVCPQSGYSAVGGDCDDTNAAIGADTPELLFEDRDGDGFGSGVAVSICPQPGWVATGDDCDDNDSLIGEMTTVYTDGDGDGYGVGAPFSACSGPGLALVDGDCDDTRDDIGPGTPIALYFDVDGDGYGGGSQQVVCPQPGWVALGGDCNDGDPAVNPGAVEVACSSVDDDCEPLTPDGPVFQSDAEFASIQQGLDVGTDDLLVCPGLYPEALNIGRAVTIAAAIPQTVVEIDPVAGPAVTVTAGGAVALEGLTLRPGTGAADGYGGAIAAVDPMTTLTLTAMDIDPTTVNYGAQVASRGPLVIVDTLLQTGSANVDGGCVWAEGDLELRGSTMFDDCHADGGRGGAAWVGGDLSADDSVEICGSSADVGGGVWVAGVASLGADTLLCGNAAGTAGGGAWMEGPNWSGGTLSDNRSEFGSGGGLAMLGGQVLDATFFANTATWGGAVHGADEIYGSSILANNAMDGAGIYAVADLLIEDTILDSNIATGNGGGIWVGGSLTALGASRIEDNTAVLGGGLYALQADPQPDAVDPLAADLVVIDLGGITVEDNTADQGGGLYGTFVNVLGLSATGNHATIAGGGALLGGTYLTDPVVTGNSSDGDGAGLANDDVHFLTLTRGVVDGNTALGNGGGIAVAGSTKGLTLDGTVVSANAAALGGGVYVAGTTASMVTGPVTLSGNDAVDGGGLYQTADCPVGATCGPENYCYARLTGATVEDNVASGDGGGALIDAFGYLFSSTFANNEAGGDGGGVGCKAQCSIYDTGTSFVGNTAGDLGGGLWSDSGIYWSVGGAFEFNQALRGAAIGISGYNAGYYDWDDYNYLLRSVTVTGGSLTSNTLDAGGDGGIAYLDGSVDVAIRLIFDGGSTWSMNTADDVEWIKSGGILGFASLISGDDYTCQPFGGCP